MTEQMWTEMDRFFESKLFPPDPSLERILHENAAAGIPAIDVSPAHGQFLAMMARMIGAKHILEIGTLGGYSAACLAKSLPEGGSVVTLEIDQRHGAVARQNFVEAGVADKIDLRIGPARQSLEALVSEDRAPFDLAFVDADKDNNPHYLTSILALTRPGSLIVFDNMTRSGGVLDGASEDPRVQGVRHTLDMISSDPRLMATGLQTTGVKGWDAFVIVLVVGTD